MSRCLVGLCAGLFSLLGVCVGVCVGVYVPEAHAAPVAAPIVITFAEQPARLARDTSLYRAGRGVLLRANDMLESGAGAIQFEAGGATFAIGPASRIFIRRGGEIVLLDGWLKLQARGGQAPAVTTSNLALAATASGGGASLILRAAGGASELFAESGALQVHELDAGKRKRGAAVAPEHFAARSGMLPLRGAERAPPAFLAAMPRSFRDVLVPLAANGAAVAPKLERTATFAELAPWLPDHAALRQQVRARFDPPRPARKAPSHPSTAQY